MDWMAQVDNYCERVDPSFWSEPVNAVTNAAFVLAALVIWGMLGGKRDPGARLLTLNLLVIGIGSFLFHTYATRWAGMMDTIPIVSFILIYVYLATTRFFALNHVWGVVAAVGFLPYAAAVSWGLGAVVGSLNGSIHYVPVPILILIYAALVIRRDPMTARGLSLGAGLLIVSLAFRTLDAAACQVLPIGTHFLWHILNGALLGWMILVLHRHQVHRF